MKGVKVSKRQLHTESPALLDTMAKKEKQERLKAGNGYATPMQKMMNERFNKDNL